VPMTPMPRLIMFSSLNAFASSTGQTRNEFTF
jgi:hypothetical protein